MESSIDVPWDSAEMCVDSKASTDIDGGKEAAEMASHIESEGSAEYRDREEGEGGHDNDDKKLPAERVEEAESSG